MSDINKMKKREPMKLEPKKPAAKKRIGRPPLPPELRRSAKLSLRTYKNVYEKARRVGTEAVEQAILKIKE